MRMPRSNRFLLNPSEKKTLARMARNDSRVNGVDKGENSDGNSSDSLEEISAEDFRQDGRRSRSRVWDDGMMSYSVARNFGPTLYSFAWAQAVQNKPLGLGIKPVEDGDSSEDLAGGLEMEKEEGELEEGEIDLESDVAVAEEIVNVAECKTTDVLESKESEEKEEGDIEDFDRRVAEILEELDTITPDEAEA